MTCTRCRLDTYGGEHRSSLACVKALRGEVTRLREMLVARGGKRLALTWKSTADGVLVVATSTDPSVSAESLARATAYVVGPRLE